jgi:Glycosyl-4,4'-diaponeurosporenoate acyltransferase
LTRWDRPELYERLGVRHLRGRFPEAGALFGGVSKRRAPDLADAESVRAYLIEVRRAEWVHWLSMACWLPLPLFQPPWLAGALLIPTAAVNGAAQLILRYNKARLSLAGGHPPPPRDQEPKPAEEPRAG